MNYHSKKKKVLDRDKTSLMFSQAFISVEHCSSTITQFHTNIKILSNEPFVSNTRYLGAAVNVQQH